MLDAGGCCCGQERVAEGAEVAETAPAELPLARCARNDACIDNGPMLWAEEASPTADSGAGGVPADSPCMHEPVRGTRHSG